MADKDKKTMRLYFRRSSTIGAVTHLAGSFDTVEVTDEAWRAVNRGDADVNPPPGTGGQPHPDDIPDWVKESEATEAPQPPPAQVMMIQQPPAAAAPQKAPAGGKAKGTGGTPESAGQPAPHEANKLDRPEDKSRAAEKKG